MAKTLNGVMIKIVAFLETGTSIDEQLASLTALKAAHETGNYGEVIGKSRIIKVSSEARRQRFEEETVDDAVQTDIEDAIGDAANEADYQDIVDENEEVPEEVPQFIAPRKGRKAA